MYRIQNIANTAINRRFSIELHIYYKLFNKGYDANTIAKAS